MRWLVVAAIVGALTACGAVTAEAPATKASGQWSKADCSWAIQTLVNAVWDDARYEIKAKAAGQTDLAAFYAGWVRTHSQEKEAAWTHCGRSRAGSTESDEQAIKSLAAARQSHLDRAAWQEAHGQLGANDYENVAYYDRLIALFRIGVCPDALCYYPPGTPAAGDYERDR